MLKARWSNQQIYTKPFHSYYVLDRWTCHEKCIPIWGFGLSMHSTVYIYNILTYISNYWIISHPPKTVQRKTGRCRHCFSFIVIYVCLMRKSKPIYEGRAFRKLITSMPAPYFSSFRALYFGYIETMIYRQNRYFFFN